MRNALNSLHRKGDKKDPLAYFVSFILKIFSPENIWALVLFIIVAALIIITTDDSPNWIYQGF